MAHARVRLLVALAALCFACGAPASRLVAEPPATGPPTTTTTVATVPATTVPPVVVTSTTVRPSRSRPAAKPRPVPPAPVAPAVPQAGNSQTGGASWYETFNGTCAHRTLPKGTIVTVTVVAGPAAGKSVNCRVADRGPYIAGRIIDLDKQLFAALAPVGSGVLAVMISW